MKKKKIGWKNLGRKKRKKNIVEIKCMRERGGQGKERRDRKNGRGTGMNKIQKGRE